MNQQIRVFISAFSTCDTNVNQPLAWTLHVQFLNIHKCIGSDFGPTKY